MLEHVQQFIEEQELFTKEDHLLVTVSGGVDSMVLLTILHALGYQYSVAHCNFQLRGKESDEDAAFVRAYAKQLGITYYEKVVETEKLAQQEGISLQMAARAVRYNYFSILLAQGVADYIVTAHHVDDRIETFWLNFTRGSGWRGLASLEAEVDEIRRPLLGVNRAQIEQYQQANNIPFREDSSNASDKYRRNSFRHHILPQLYEWEPQLGVRADANFRRMEEMLLLYEEQIAEYKAKWFQRKYQHWFTPREELLKHPARQTLAWEFWGTYGFNQEHIRQALTAKIGTIVTTENAELLVQADGWLLRLKLPDHATMEEYQWLAGQPQLELPNGSQLTLESLATIPTEFSNPPHVAYLDADQLQFPLHIRRWMKGDRFCPLGMGGKHQSLQDFFTNNKINRWERVQLWLLVNGDGRIIWIIGKRLDDRFKITERTRRVQVVRWT